MLEKIEHVIELVAKSKDDKTTRALTIGAVVSFGVAVGAIAVYDHLAKKLNLTHDEKARRSRIEVYDDEDYY